MKNLSFKLLMFSFSFLAVAVFVFLTFDFGRNKVSYSAEVSCKGPADVILAIDRSGTMSNYSKFSVAKSSSVNFIDKLFGTVPDISYAPFDYHQMGLVAFSNTVDVELLNQNGEYIKSVINNPNGILGGSYPIGNRNLKTALRQVWQKLEPSAGHNPSATKTAIILTDGPPYPTSDIELAKNEADVAKSKGVRIIPIGLRLDTIVNEVDRTNAEEFIKYIASTPADCYYVSDSESISNCNYVSAAGGLDAALDGIYNSITAAVCDNSPPTVNIARIPSGTLYNVDKLKIVSTAVDDVGFKSHTIKWSDNWPNNAQTVECGNLIGTTISCDTGELGPFSSGKVISYRSFAEDANDNEASIGLPDPRSVTVAAVSLNVPALFRNTNNNISVNISDPEGKANLDEFYIRVDNDGVKRIDETSLSSKMSSCSGTGFNFTCSYNFNPSCANAGVYPANTVDIYIYAKSGTGYHSNPIASQLNKALGLLSEGVSWGNCGDGIDNDCDGIIDLGETACDSVAPTTSISRNPAGDVYDNDSITFVSNAFDSNGIRQHTIFYRINSGSWQTAFDCNDANIDLKCDENINQSVGSISATVGSFAAGSKIEYYSRAVDYSGNNNAGSSATGSFIVKNRECEGVSNLGACKVTPGGKCCEGVCNSTISNPGSYNTDYCTKEICNGISWEWGIDIGKNNTICSESGDSDGCYSYLPPSYFWDGGCEERAYRCSSGYCTYGVVNRNEDHCIGGGSLILNDYECVDNSCALSPNPAVENDICDLELDSLSINAYNSANTLICGSSGAATGEVLDNLTNTVSLRSITSDTNSISEQKIYWKKTSETSFNVGNCNVGSCGTNENPCNCTQNIGPFGIGEMVEFYATSRDDSPNKTERDEGGSNGLRYYYYDGVNFDIYKGSGIDTNVNHYWTSGKVAINNNSWEDQYDTVSIIWEGMARPDVLGEHTFYVSTDDGIKFYINGNLVINKWFNQGTTEYSAAYDFTSLKSVPIRIKWYESGGYATMQLGWKPPGGSKVYPIPTSNLISPYFFTVHNHECYDVPGGNKPDLTSCASGSGKCCGGACDSAVSTTPYDEECRIDACSGTNWVYVAGNEGNLCGLAGTCFDYYTGCISGNKCISGYCSPDLTGKQVDSCIGNLFDNYGCLGGVCGLISGGLDCSSSGNSDGDSVACNCDCNGYDIKEKVYSSLSFDGMDDYVKIPNSISNSNSVTAEAWVKPNNFPDTYATIYFLGDYQSSSVGYNWLFISGGSLHWQFASSTGWQWKSSTSITWTPGQWYHIAAVHDYSKKEIRFYRDGNLLGSPIAHTGDVIPVSNKSSRIGMYPTGNYYRFNGSIDEVRVYNRALYPEEIKDHYNGIFASNTGLMGYWNFDEGAGETADDSSGNNNHGTLSNVDGILGGGTPSYMPSWTPSGKYGYALNFDGSNDYVDLNNLGLSTSTNSKVSVEFWMKWNGGNSQMPFGWSSYDLWFYGGNFGFNTFASDIWGISSSGLSGKWVHIIAVFNNGDAKLSELYLDGSKQTLSQRMGSTGSRTISSNARVSGYSGGSGYKFGGLIDEVRIYDRTLSITEAAEHYKGVFGDNAGLVGYWNFNEGSGTTAYDSSENGPKWMKYYHGSASGASGNVPIYWQTCTDGKDNDCDMIVDEYDNNAVISNCDGKLDAISVVATAKNRTCVEDPGCTEGGDLFSGSTATEAYDIDIERSVNDFTLTVNTVDDFSVKQIVIEWTANNWATKTSKVCNGTGVCEVCINGGTCGTGNDLISSLSLSADNVFKFRTCGWDNSINNNKKCTEEYIIVVRSSNSAPLITPLSVLAPDFCVQGLKYILKWSFSDPEGDGQGHYEIQVKKDNNDFESGTLVANEIKFLPDYYYLIPDGTLDYENKTYFWRVRVTDNRSGGYEETTDWEEGPSFITPLYRYPQVDFSVSPDYSNGGIECTSETGLRCDFGENITFSDNSVFVSCNNSNNKQCIISNTAKCDTVNGFCVSCDSNSQCVKFGSGYKCESGICKPPDGFSCASDDNCKTADAAKCNIETELCAACDDDSQCTNSKFDTIGIDYFCNSAGRCEDKEHRKWYFYLDAGEPDSRDPSPVHNYIESEVNTYDVTLRVKDIFGNYCSKVKRILLGGRTYPKWNEISPSN